MIEIILEMIEQVLEKDVWDEPWKDVFEMNQGTSGCLDEC